MAKMSPQLPYPAVMSEEIELIYDRLVAREKLKSGTKYERLAAIVFTILLETQAVHDLRLRGSSKVLHQIDVTVGTGRKRKRILIECKDMGKPVGLPLVRNFWGAVEDLQPDQAFIVTTNRFTEPGEKFALAKGIVPALLRAPHEEDLAGLLRRIQLEIRISTPLEDASIQWQADAATPETDLKKISPGLVATSEIVFIDQGDRETPAQPEIERLISPKLGFEGVHRVDHQFSDPVWFRIGDGPKVKLVGFKSRQEWGVAVMEQTIEAAGRLAAELVLRTADNSTRRVFSAAEIQQWTIDDAGKVVPTSD